MRMQYLGTAAAEGIPAVFCQCETCRKASAAGGREIRTRAGALINGRILLDLTPDLYLHKLKYGLDLSAVEAVFVTHSHTDHFDGAELTRRSSQNYCYIEGEKPLKVYGNGKVCRLGRESLELEFGKREDPSIEFCELKPYEPATAGGVEFIPIPAVHDPAEVCYIYLVRQGGAALLYGNDTGLPGEEVFEFLKGIKLGMVSLDCTFGNAGFTGDSHMGLPENAEFVGRLRELGCVTENTKIFATHFSHNCGMSHAELDRTCMEKGMRAAYDGLAVEL